MIPPSLAFRREREATWRELERLVSRAESSRMASLNARDLARFPLLYRTTVASLAAARSYSVNQNLLSYLEDLVARAHICLHTSKPAFWKEARDFFAYRFPVQVRTYGRYLLLSTLIFGAGVLTAFLLTQANPERFHNFVPEAYAQGRGPEASTQSLQESLHGGGDTDELAQFSSMLFNNNARVGILCFALGFALGIPVLYLLFTNGLILGAFAAVYHERALGAEFWGWILPHGSPEILAVLLCGAAGLAMANSVIFPGRLRRLSNLTKVGRESGQIVLGAIFLFLLASFVEGFFRQMVHDTTMRYLVFAAISTTLLSYFLLAGRRRRQER